MCWFLKNSAVIFCQNCGNNGSGSLKKEKLFETILDGWGGVCDTLYFSISQANPNYTNIDEDDVLELLGGPSLTWQFSFSVSYGQLLTNAADSDGYFPLDSNYLLEYIDSHKRKSLFIASTIQYKKHERNQTPVCWPLNVQTPKTSVYYEYKKKTKKKTTKNPKKQKQNKNKAKKQNKTKQKTPSVPSRNPSLSILLSFKICRYL